MSKRRDDDIHEQLTTDGTDEAPTIDQDDAHDPHEAETMDGAVGDEMPTMDGDASEAQTTDSHVLDDEEATVDLPGDRSNDAQQESTIPPGFKTIEANAEAPTVAATSTGGGGGDDPALPKNVGQYRIVRLIGAGGMGAVFEAEQDNPRRSVALKLMKSGIASKSALRRFEYESQLLGRLRHPGIAQVYEAGVHDDGTGAVPYFAMEFIPDAQTLTAYAQKQGLNIDQKLKLFMKVCDAVHHGHQKGIIHRDLKPDNILVDASAQPKIIDFGVARTTDSDIQAATVQTEVGQLVGTVPYMSPEQIEADPADIDTRSDVYGLGVVLYRLLTGKLPYDLSGTPVYEATRIIKEQAPLRMSTVNHSLKGDVETIVLHALEKDRDRRYQSALELQQDIQRYLNNEPIHARPASLLYTWSRFAQRNKLLVGSIAIVFVLLVGGVIGTTTGLVKATTALNEKKLELARAEASSGFFGDMLTLVLNARKDEVSVEGKAGEATVEDFLDVAVPEVDVRLKEYPEVAAYMLWKFGNGYRELTKYEKAEPQYRQALTLQREHLEPPHEHLALLLRDYGAMLWWTGRYDEAEPLLRESMEMYEELAGGEETEELARSIDYLAACLNKMQRHEETNKLYNRALEMRRRISSEVMVGRTKNNWGMSKRDQKEYGEAARLIAEATEIVREHRGDRHIDVANGLTNRSSCLINLALEQLQESNSTEAVVLLNEAERDLREALDIKQAELREDHASIATTQYHLANTLLQLDRLADRDSLAEAEQLARAALALQQSGYGPDDSRVIDTMKLLIRILDAAGDNDGAALLQQELDGLKQPVH